MHLLRVRNRIYENEILIICKKKKKKKFNLNLILIIQLIFI